MQQHEVMIYLNAMFLPVSLTLFTLGNTYMFFFSNTQLKTLKSDLRTARKRGFADSTAQNLRIQWKSFLLIDFISI